MNLNVEWHKAWNSLPLSLENCAHMKCILHCVFSGGKLAWVRPNAVSVVTIVEIEVIGLSTVCFLEIIAC